MAIKKLKMARNENVYIMKITSSNIRLVEQCSRVGYCTGWNTMGEQTTVKRPVCTQHIANSL